MKLIAGILFLLSIASPCLAAPCDFKGISVGERISKKQIFKKLGIKNFKLERGGDYVVERKEDVAAYGHLGATELALWRAGTICMESACSIPVGVEIEKNIPASVLILYGGNDLVTDIRVNFSVKHWKTVFPKLTQKYGVAWEEQKEDRFVIEDQKSGKSLTVDRTLRSQKGRGTNPKTKARCEIYATDYDSMFIHHNPLGPYQSFFGISLRN